MNKIIIFILIFSFCATTCTTNNKFQKQKPECLTADYKGFYIEWGYIDNKNNTTTGYSLYEDGYILMFIQKSNQKKYDTICQVEPQQLCNVLKLYITESLKIPVVNESGDELAFINFYKPVKDYRSNAIWNKFNTYASTGYRNVFDSLMVLVKLSNR